MRIPIWKFHLFIMLLFILGAATHAGASPLNMSISGYTSSTTIIDISPDIDIGVNEVSGHIGTGERLKMEWTMGATHTLTSWTVMYTRVAEGDGNLADWHTTSWVDGAGGSSAYSVYGALELGIESITIDLFPAHDPFLTGRTPWKYRLTLSKPDIDSTLTYDYTMLFTITGEGEEVADQNPVPEPATFLLLGIGIVGLAGADLRRRRKKKAMANS